MFISKNLLFFITAGSLSDSLKFPIGNILLTINSRSSINDRKQVSNNVPSEQFDRQTFLRPLIDNFKRTLIRLIAKMLPLSSHCTNIIKQID